MEKTQLEIKLKLFKDITSPAEGVLSETSIPCPPGAVGVTAYWVASKQVFVAQAHLWNGKVEKLKDLNWSAAPDKFKAIAAAIEVKLGEDEVWADVSVLHQEIAKQENWKSYELHALLSKFETTWLFSAASSEMNDPGSRTLPQALTQRTEAQARFISSAPTIPLRTVDQ